MILLLLIAPELSLRLAPLHALHDTSIRIDGTREMIKDGVELMTELFPIKSKYDVNTRRK